MAPKLIIVNYHYIRDSEPKRGIYNVTPNFFKKQLNSIYENGYRFTSLDDIHKALINHDFSRLNRDLCLITFDDGLKESYDIGYKILKEMGIPAAFYISSATIERAQVIDVHKLHYIQTVLNNEEILHKLPKYLMDRLNHVPEEMISKQYIWDDIELARIKYLINFLMSSEEKVATIGNIFSYCCSNENKYAENLYMTKEQIKDLSSNNFIGSHGVSHMPLASLSDAHLTYELSESQKALHQLTGEKIQSITYPYGGESAVNQRVIQFARKSSYLSGMTMMRGVNYINTLLEESLMLKRFDTNDVYGGKSEFKFRGFL